MLLFGVLIWVSLIESHLLVPFYSTMFRRFIAPCLAVVFTAEAAPVFSPLLRETYLVDGRELLAGPPELMTWLDGHPEVLTGILASADPVPS